MYHKSEVMPMKRYIKNLWLALTGSDPYQAELVEKDRQLENAAVNVNSLQEIYYDILDKYTDAKERLAKSEKQVMSYQALVENQRERIRDFQQRIEDYNKEMDRLLREKQ